MNKKPRKSKKTPFHLIDRLVAFITDMFMINMPILYITTYFVLGSKEAFLENHIAIFVCVILFGIITSLSFAVSGQTPGYRYARIKLVQEGADIQKPSFLVAFLRYLLWIFSMACVVGVLLALFRKDSKTLYDLVCHTKVVSLEKL